MAHTLGGQTLYVTSDDGVNAVINAELNVLDSTKSTVQHFSKPSPRRRLIAHVITETIMDAIKALSSGSAAVNYTSDQGSQGNYYVLNVADKRLRGTPIGFGGALSTDAAYVATIDMLEE